MPARESIGSRLASLFGIAGKAAIITGAASGLGRETATLFADLGAQVVLFLASPASSYVTGQLLAADGGFTVS